jgi:hypothetical protein
LFFDNFITVNAFLAIARNRGHLPTGCTGSNVNTFG